EPRRKAGREATPAFPRTWGPCGRVFPGETPRPLCPTGRAYTRFTGSPPVQVRLLSPPLSRAGAEGLHRLSNSRGGRGVFFFNTRAGPGPCSFSPPHPKPGGPNMGQPRLRENVAHIRYNGKSLDVTLAALGLSPDSDAAEVRRQVARYLETPEYQLHDHAVD